MEVINYIINGLLLTVAITVLVIILRAIYIITRVVVAKIKRVSNG